MTPQLADAGLTDGLFTANDQDTSPRDDTSRGACGWLRPGDLSHHTITEARIVGD